MTRKNTLALVVSVVLTAAVAMTAQQQAVILKDGGRIVGEVTKIENGYQVRTDKGIVTEYRANQVLRVEDVVTQSEELKQRLGRINSRDAEGHYQVARWAVEKNLPAEARKVLLTTLKIKPNHENARLLLKLVEIRLAKPTETAPTTPTTRPVAQTVLDPSRFLTKEDIYRIRLMELKHNDRVVIQFRNNALERFIKSMRGVGIFKDPAGERRFRGAPKVQQARYILENTDRDNAAIRDDILVKTDPAVIKVFRTRVWPIISKSFASPSCYGGSKGRDGMKLFNVPLTDERIMYTNFYILHKWHRGGRRFINRDSREMSLLLQYGLPRKLARIPAPDYIKEPVFRSREGPRYRIIDAWIGSLRWPFLPPGYRINYKLPEQESPKRQPPATAPSP